jgi:uncharacterized protein (TIGR02147 family)
LEKQQGKTTVKTISVFKYTAFADVLKAWLNARKANKKPSSMRWLAQRIDLKSHAYLSRIASGLKPPTEALLLFMGRSMELSIDEFAYLKALAARDFAKTKEERTFLSEKIASFRKHEGEVLLALDQFELISRWYHIAIFEMMNIKGFKSDPSWIAAKLQGEVSVSAVEESLARLERLGFIEKRRNGDYVKKTNDITTTSNIPSEVIRNFHRELLHTSIDALDKVPVAERLFYSRTMAINMNDLQEAEEFLLECRSKFAQRFETRDANAVYHLAFQLVPLSEVIVTSPSRLKSK